MENCHSQSIDPPTAASLKEAWKSCLARGFVSSVGTTLVCINSGHAFQLDQARELWLSQDQMVTFVRSFDPVALNLYVACKVSVLLAGHHSPWLGFHFLWGEGGNRFLGWPSSEIALSFSSMASSLELPWGCLLQPVQVTGQLAFSL